MSHLSRKALRWTLSLSAPGLPAYRPPTNWRVSDRRSPSLIAAA